MRYSVIDIGTNTMLMLIAEYDITSNSVTTVLDILRAPRLGKGVDAARNITTESISKAIAVLNEYKKISSEYKSEKIFATATSFIRDSSNKDEFLSEINKKTGIDIEILSGEEEANRTFIGGVFDKFSAAGTKPNFTTIDIGGGSTEIAVGIINPDRKAKTFDNFSVEGRSLDIGSVRINEKYLDHHPPAFEQLVIAENFVNQYLDEIDFDIKGSELIGIAGTVTTLAAIKLGLTEYDASKVDGVVMTLDEIESIFTRLAAMPIEELYSLGGFMEGRADIIIPGILILQTFMEKFGFGKITVSSKGLRYGTFIRAITNY